MSKSGLFRSGHVQIRTFQVRTCPNQDFWLNFACFGFKIRFLTKWRNDSASFCPEELKKHIILIKNLNIWEKIKVFIQIKLRKNHTESSGNFIKNPILNPQHAKFDQQSEIGHVRTCQDLSKRTSTYCKPAEISLFFRSYTFPFFITKFNIFLKKSSVLLNKFIIFL